MNTSRLISSFAFATISIACAAPKDESGATETGEAAFSHETCTWSFEYPNTYHWVAREGGASGECYRELSSVYLKCRDDANATCAKLDGSSSSSGGAESRPTWECTFRPFYSELLPVDSLTAQGARDIALAQCQSAGRIACEASCYCPYAAGCASPSTFSCKVWGHGAKRTVRHDVSTEAEARELTGEACPIGCDYIECSRVR